MISNNDLRNIIRTIVEEKKDLHGAAHGSWRKKKADEIAQADATSKIEEVSPGATLKALKALRDAAVAHHEKISKIFDHPGTPPPVAKLDGHLRITSHHERVIKHLESEIAKLESK